jgi:hypothetical protein
VQDDEVDERSTTMSYVLVSVGPYVFDSDGEEVKAWRVNLDTHEQEPLLSDGSIGRRPVTRPPDPVEPVTDWTLAGNGARIWRR